MKYAFTAMFVLLLVGCGRTTQPKPEQAMRFTSAPDLRDSLSGASLIGALDQQIVFLGSKNLDHKMRFGSREISRKEYLKSLEELKQRLEAEGMDESLEWIQDHFDFFEVYGDRGWGDVFVTGYFEPRIYGSHHRTERFSQPLYAKPKDIYRLKLDAFGFKAEAPRELRARIENDVVVPYYSREQIDSELKLSGQGLELCWVGPIDAFFLQIQGSGIVELEDGRELKLIYSEKNGAPYQAIGKFLKERIAPEEITLFSIEKYLRTLDSNERQAELNKNPSYVFFKEHEHGAITYLGVRASAGRTIATDKRFFPKGALAFLDIGGASRFVLDQDIGGAITGAGRVDLFTGSGEEGKKLSGAMKERGKLYYLVPKEA